MILNSKQINEVLKIVDKYHLLYISSNIGTDILSEEDIMLLRSFGIDINQIEQQFLIENTFQFGILADSLKYNKAKKVSYKDFKKFLKENDPIPLNEIEKLAIESIKYRAYSDIKNLGSKIRFTVNNHIIEDRSKRRAIYENILRNESISAIENKKSVRNLKSEIYGKTKDWYRDLDRVADFIFHTAFDQGKTHSILRKHGEYAKVFKYVMPGACKKCVSAYLTAGEGSKPKIFLLKEIIENGTNIGKKQDEWKPVIGPHHPWCRCEMNHYDERYEWDEDDKSFTKLKKIKRKRKSRAKVIIN